MLGLNDFPTVTELQQEWKNSMFMSIVGERNAEKVCLIDMFLGLAY